MWRGYYFNTIYIAIAFNKPNPPLTPPLDFLQFLTFTCSLFPTEEYFTRSSLPYKDPILAFMARAEASSVSPVFNIVN